MEPGASPVTGKQVFQIPAQTELALKPGAVSPSWFTHRVRVNTINDLNAHLLAWLKQAYHLAG